MSTINTDVKALAAQSSINNVDRSLQTFMQRLSTGLRINNAKDDAAGLAIANRMTSDIRGFGVAIRDLPPSCRTKVMEQSPLISENSGYETIQIYR